MNNLLGLIVFLSSIALAMCLWNDSSYTNKVAGVLIFSYISFLVNNEMNKNEN